LEDARNGSSSALESSSALTSLESLELRGAHFDNDALEMQLLINTVAEPSSAPLMYMPPEFPNLHALTLLSIPTSSNLFMSLLFAPLPNLTTLTLTPYNDLPFQLLPPLFPPTFAEDSLSLRFLQAHGEKLKKLTLITPRAMGVRSHEAPRIEQILTLCPALRWLEVEPPFLPPPHTVSSPTPTPQKPHPLHILTLPRPISSLLTETIEPLLSKSVLSQLTVLRLRDVKWLTTGRMSGMSRAAGETGVQGEMRVWRRRLGARWGIRVVDGAGGYGEEK
jgi:hypothetical protein